MVTQICDGFNINGSDSENEQSAHGQRLCCLRKVPVLTWDRTSRGSSLRSAHGQRLCCLRKVPVLTWDRASRGSSLRYSHGQRRCCVRKMPVLTRDRILRGSSCRSSTSRMILFQCRFTGPADFNRSSCDMDFEGYCFFMETMLTLDSSLCHGSRSHSKTSE